MEYTHFVSVAALVYNVTGEVLSFCEEKEAGKI